jgi:hypothetical protein
MPIPSSLYLLYECIKDSDPKNINPRKNLERMVDYIVGDPEDIIGQGGSIDYDDLEWEDNDDYYDYD